MRPPLNEKLFPVNRQGGSKRADWNFFFLFKKKKIVFTFPPVHSSLEKNEIRKKRNPHLLTGRFLPNWPAGNDFFQLKVAGCIDIQYDQTQILYFFAS